MNLLDFVKLKNPTSLFPLNANNVPPIAPIPDNFFSRLLPEATQAKEDRLAKLQKDLVTQDYIKRFGEYGNNSQRRIADLNTPESIPNSIVNPYYAGDKLPSERKFENPNIISKPLGNNNIVGQEDWYESYNRSPDNPNAFPVGQEPISNEIVDPDTIEPEEKTSRFKSLFNIFDDKDRLAKIATGIALMEGTPMQEAFQIGADIRAQGEVELGKVDVEVIDKQTGKVVFSGSSDSDTIRAYAAQSNRYQIVPLGSSFDAQTEKTSAIRESSNKQLDADKATLRDIDAQGEIFTEMLALLEGGLETGVTKNRLYFAKKFLGLTGDLSKEELFEAYANRLIPMYRVEGSGSTSDIEFAAMKSAAPELGKETETNIALVNAGLRIFKMKKEKSAYLEVQINENDLSYSEAEKSWVEHLDSNADVQTRIFGNRVVTNMQDNPEPGTYLILDSKSEYYNTVQEIN
tara:strand:+ start:43 stop:1425 length:1383 start_codon:yes stop_codon:yes gene_type:complete